jgi:hypothetical protein
MKAKTSLILKRIRRPYLLAGISNVPRLNLFLTVFSAIPNIRAVSGIGTRRSLHRLQLLPVVSLSHILNPKKEKTRARLIKGPPLKSTPTGLPADHILN